MLPKMAQAGALIGDPVRARMLFELLDGREMSASDLAAAARASAQSASGHLAKLRAGGMIVARDSGRHRFFRLASRDVARALEALATIAPARPVASLEESTKLGRLRAARSCYDHLAGRLGVGVTESLVARGLLRERGDSYDVTRAGKTFFDDLGLQTAAASASRRPFARTCLDWTERRHHVAGRLGSSLLGLFLARRWVQRHPRERSLRITPAGSDALRSVFELPADVT